MKSLEFKPILYRKPFQASKVTTDSFGKFDNEK